MKQSKYKRVLITGVAGFIGSTIAETLIQNKHTVFGIDNLSSGKIENIPQNVKYQIIDIRNDLTSVFEKHGPFDAVIHCAASVSLRNSLTHPKNDADNNILGTLNLIENCLKYNVPKFIFSSSGAVYDPNASLPWDENSNTLPQSPYGISKKTVENYLELFEKLHKNKFEAVCLRYSNVYGPKQNSGNGYGVISIFIDKMMKNESINVFGDGKQTRDYISSTLIAEANLLAVEGILTSGIYNVSSNTKTSVNDIIDKILLNLSFYSGEIKYLPKIEGELQDSQLSNKKLLDTGLWINDIALDEGIKKTMDWYRNLNKK